MPRIIFISPSGVEKSVEVECGETAMKAALTNDVKGIIGDCGGSCSCATCHVYVDPEFMSALPPYGPFEEEMLEGVAAERKPTSRLSCQIVMTDELDGLVIRIPETQN